MTKEITTILETGREWAGTLSTFPLGTIEKLFDLDIGGWREITPVSEGCRVWGNRNQEMGYIKEIKENEDGEEVTVIELGNGEKVGESKEDLSREDGNYFPIWETIRQFSGPCNNQWTEDHLNEMTNYGLRIYELNGFGYFFGIDGTGYDFYETYWIPLYNKHGLWWHTVV